MSTLKIKGTSSGEVVLSANADGSQLSVDQKIIGANVNNRPNPAPLIINGDMRVAQYSFDTSFTKTGVNDHSGGAVTCIDRMYTGITDNGTFTISRDTDVPTGYGFVNSMKLDCTTADTSVAAGSFHTLEYRFEGQDLQHFKKGLSTANTWTMSFYVKSTTTGTYICQLFDNNNNRFVSKSYTVSTANTWEKKTITFPADTTGELANTNGNCLIIGNGASKFKTLNPKIDAHFNKEIHYPSAEDMCLLAWNKFKNKDFEVLASFEPYYLKDFQTTSSKKE